MRRIRLIWIGKTQEPFLRSGINLYFKKISHYIKIDSDEIKPAKYRSGTLKNWRSQETENMMKKMDLSEINIFLDQNGEQKTSKVFFILISVSKTLKIVYCIKKL